MRSTTASCAINPVRGSPANSPARYWRSTPAIAVSPSPSSHLPLTSAMLSSASSLVHPPASNSASQYPLLRSQKSAGHLRNSSVTIAAPPWTTPSGWASLAATPRATTPSLTAGVATRVSAVTRRRGPRTLGTVSLPLSVFRHPLHDVIAPSFSPTHSGTTLGWRRSIPRSPLTSVSRLSASSRDRPRTPPGVSSLATPPPPIGATRFMNAHCPDITNFPSARRPRTSQSRSRSFPCPAAASRRILTNEAGHSESRGLWARVLNVTPSRASRCILYRTGYSLACTSGIAPQSPPLPQRRWCASSPLTTRPSLPLSTMSASIICTIVSASSRTTVPSPTPHASREAATITDTVVVPKPTECLPAWSSAPSRRPRRSAP